MTGSPTLVHLAGALVRCGVGLLVSGLVVGCGLIFRYFFVTPFEVCSAGFATMTVGEVWAWAFPLLAVEGFALTLVASGLCLLPTVRRSLAPVPGTVQRRIPLTNQRNSS